MLTPKQHHYLKNVLRLKDGDALIIFNENDGEWLARIARLDRKSGVLELLEKWRDPSVSPDIWVCFAPVKRAPVDLIAEKATELGARVLQPVMTQNTDVKRVNTERLRAIAVEAAEQCERLDVPEIRGPVKLAALLKDWPEDRKILLCAEIGEHMPIRDALELMQPGSLAILTGPEGGFTEQEIKNLCRIPFIRPVSLGPRILRAETAVIAALACVQAHLGDWS